MPKITKEAALTYHSKGRPGKLEVVPTKPHAKQRDLGLAYSPGVAYPCLEIEKNADDAYRYTARGNLVAVISNGTAVLGLGDIGALGSKPVMEGKGLLFKIFSDIDVFDIEIDQTDVDQFVTTVKAIAPTFGGINLEDIKAPECFAIEKRLKAELDIPVMHDDQHGTAIISAAALVNALELNGKKLEDLKVVVNGAGASAIACTNLYLSLGVQRKNVVMCDSKGVIHEQRTDLNEFKRPFATNRNVRTLTEALVGADVFLGLSIGNIVSKEMVQSMANNPIVFAMANPDPEINYDDATAARNDIIMATGRSDYPNQVNNVLGFPFIFRGALDVKATAINEEMKKAAVMALARLAKEPVPEAVSEAYNIDNLIFGREYLIPKPFDPRLITTVAPAVAKAAMDSGVARTPITNWDSYREELSRRMGLDSSLMRNIMARARKSPRRLVMAEAENFKMLKAAEELMHDGTALPVLIGRKNLIEKQIKEYSLDLPGVEIIDSRSAETLEKRKEYADLYWQKRQRKGVGCNMAFERMHNSNYFGLAMVEAGEADAFISGVNSKYREIISPALQIIGTEDEVMHIAGMYIVMSKRGPIFFADTTVNLEPTVEALVNITLLTAREVRRFNVEPVIAMLSCSNFGSIAKTPCSAILRETVSVLHRDHPDLIVDGEIQANYAFNTGKRQNRFPFNKIGNREVNTVIFPNLAAGNIAYKTMQELAGSEVIGPVLMGMRKPVHVVQMDSSVREIVNMAAIAVIDAQKNRE